MEPSGARPLRADARRNRDRLLDVAARVFSEDGPEVTLDAVAKKAGVGIGTLYRHFPTREALVEAVYREELARLCGAAAELLESMPADRALRAWMDFFVDYATKKREMADALRAVIASGGDPYSESRARMTDAVTSLLRAGAAAGTVREDVLPEDVLASLTGLSMAARERRDQAARMLDLLMDGLRHTAAPR
ncbi:TetR family transcriptional regulator [Sphaerisporangium krabiense]|uniref:AcrR family transcriptional regulator n=1 Tax=Sphaerisporangium krabiense TaxID=763782 RepID=A0A7W8Z5J4_9ACTN|nr:TetR/AcrR family transcriptional regulator [Sphaerisporangium krabiense]MBB5627791.1 AcrR family transcriptional regulator [Sphaerisporangium krabiense]GII61950.1 TetR family transcriptional regulator [Sphaerisporangium krabiense]